MKASNKEAQFNITPDKGLQLLKEGNLRYQQNKQVEKNFNHQIKSTTQGQFPYATILSCIDSRVPTELVFDQGLGDLFSIRVAGNVINEDVLGSMEFGARLAGAHLIVVMGHTGCGAVKGACDDAQLGNLTGLLSKIKPAIDRVDSHPHDGSLAFRDLVSKENVEVALEEIHRKSPILQKMEENGEIKLVGAMYDIKTGAVEFYE